MSSLTTPDALVDHRAEVGGDRRLGATSGRCDGTRGEAKRLECCRVPGQPMTVPL